MNKNISGRNISIACKRSLEKQGFCYGQALQTSISTKSFTKRHMIRQEGIISLGWTGRGEKVAPDERGEFQRVWLRTLLAPNNT